MAVASLEGARARRLAAEIHREIGALDRLCREVDEALQTISGSTPSTLLVRGAANLVHDFYTGAEKIFELVAVSLDGGLPEGPRWHRRLLDAMALDLPGLRPPAISPATLLELEEYLRFRHLFRNVYGFELDWPRVRPLLIRLPGLHRRLVADLEELLQLLAVLAGDEAQE